MKKVNTEYNKYSSLNYLTKMVLLFLTFFAIDANSQLNYTLVSSGGSYTSEKWMNITTAVDGGGTQVWGQGNGTYGNSQGLVNTTIDLQNYQGQTLYLNAWDRYADGWDGTKYTLHDENSQLVINNSNNSPNDGTDNDASGSWGNTQAQELESSEAFVVNSTGPSITQSGSLSAFSACSGGNNSAEQTFTVSGSNLTANLVVTPPSGYEVSTTSGASFASSVSLTPSSGTVASTTIYVRSTTGASAGNGGDIACTSTGASTVNVATGSLTLNSTAITDGSNITGLSSYQGVAGTASSFTTSGTCLSGDLTATAPSNFEVSLASNSGFGSSVTLSESGGTVASTTVYVRLAATQASTGAKSGDVTISGGGASSQTVAVSGTVSAAPTYYVNYASGSDANNGTSSVTAWKTLAHAFSVSGLNTTDNALLYLSSGTHYLDNEIINGNDNLTIIGDGITSTILEPVASGDQGINIASSTTGLTIRDLKIQNFAENQSGAAIDMSSSGTVIFQDVHFHNNSITSNYYDGIVYVGSSATATFDRCKFTSNDSYSGSYSDGSCIYSEGTLTVKNCLFYNNDAYSTNNGLVYIDDGDADIINCTFADNTEEPIYVYSYGPGTVNVTNCIFKDNSGNDLERDGGTVNFTYNWYESTSGTINSTTGSTTAGSVDFYGQSADDYRIGYNSACKNTGTNTGAPTDDFAENSRSDGSTDMGCYEYVCGSPVGGTAASSATVCSGSTTNLTVSGHTARAIKWQQSSDNSSWSDVSTGSNYTTNSFTTAGITSTTYYRVAASCDGSTYSATSNVVTLTVNSTIYYVNDNSTSGDTWCSGVGNDANAGTSASAPKLTLASALSVATCGSVIRVDKGTFTDDLLDITNTHDGTTIIGAGRDATIFDQSGSGDHFIEIKSSATNITISDMTIKDYDEGYSGGALDITSGAITLQDITFDNNSTTTSYDDGGAIYASSGCSSLTIDRCIFKNNESYNNSYADGSCIYSEATSIIIKNCLFYDNVCGSTSTNGHVYIDDGTATIFNCTFTENGSGSPLFLYDDGGTPTTITNCLFTNNTSSYDIQEYYTSSPYPNVSYTYYDARTGDYNTGSETGNLTSGTVGFQATGSDNFKLTSTSACKNVGTSSGAPSEDLLEISRGDGSIDMGCYEYVVYAWTGSSSTAWGTAGNWATGIAPTALDDISISDVSNDPVLSSSSDVCKNLTITGGSLTSSGSYKLTVETISQSGGSIIISDGEIECTGKADIDGALTMSGGVLDIDGEFEISSSTTESITGGTITVAGEWDGANGNQFTPTGGTVEFNGGADQAFAQHSSANFYNLTINNSSYDADAGSNFAVTGGLTVTAGELDISTNTATVTGASDIDGTLTVSTGKYDANGSFDATGGNVTFSGSGTLELGGTVTSLGTFTPGTSTVSYDGASAQDIDDFGSKSGPYNNLDLDGGAEKDLTGNTTVNGILSWSANVDMETNGHTLTIKQSPTGYDNNRVITGGSSSTVSVAYSSSSTSECFVPVGIDGSVRDISITAASGTAETYTVVYTPGSPGTINWNTTPTGVAINPSADAAHVNNHYYYDISRSGSVNATLKLKFAGLTEPTDNSDKYVMHWNSGTSRWDQLTSTGASGYVTALATSFSPFGQGSGGSALPIDLVSFNGECEDNSVDIAFTVASQQNNDYFSIYRSQNTTEWSIVGKIEGAGNTSTQMTYNWVDENPMNGYNYYRLVQTDYDGMSEGFDPIAVRCESAPVDGYSVYPNPANEVLNIDIELTSYQGNDVEIEIVDINGRIIQSQNAQLDRGYNHLEVDISEIPSGVYIINFSGTRDYIKESRIVKQ